MYTGFQFTAGEQPTVSTWNLLPNNDASFHDGTGLNDGIISWRHLASDLIPTGTIHLHAGSTAPSTAWLICDGSAVSRSTYAALFSAIGTNYGNGDGSTTFNLPNFKGNVPAGMNASDTNFNTLGKAGGEAAHSLTSSEMAVHNHGVSDPGHAHGVYDPGHAHTVPNVVVINNGSDNSTQYPADAQRITWGNQGTWGAGTGIGIYGNSTGISINNSGGGAAHNNLQPYLVVNFIIKT